MAFLTSMADEMVTLACDKSRDIFIVCKVITFKSILSPEFSMTQVAMLSKNLFSSFFILSVIFFYEDLFVHIGLNLIKGLNIIIVFNPDSTLSSISYFWHIIFHSS